MVKGDDADSGDNTDDLDPRSEFEKRKEITEKLNSDIQFYSDQLDELRRKILILETQEFDIYSAKKTRADDIDPAELKLDYHKSLCKNVIVKDKIEKIAENLGQNDKQILVQHKESQKVMKSLENLSENMNLLKSHIISRMQEKLESEYEHARSRKGELSLIIEDTMSKIERIRK